MPHHRPTIASLQPGLCLAVAAAIVMACGSGPSPAPRSRVGGTHTQDADDAGPEVDVLRGFDTTDLAAPTDAPDPDLVDTEPDSAPDSTSADVDAETVDAADQTDGSGDPDVEAGDTDDPWGEPADPEPLVFGAPTADPLNPGRGFHRWVDLLTADRGTFDALRVEGTTLAFAPVLLAPFRESPLGADFIRRLRRGLDHARSAGVQVVLRFRYDETEVGIDAPLERVLEHIGQLGGVIRDHATVIAVVEAGFIGAWGEWHTSSNELDTPEARAAVIEALVLAVPNEIGISVRTPMYKDAAVGGPLSAGTAFSDEPMARIGHHNDCFLGSDDDLGTFADPIEDWRDWLEADTAWVPMGGGACRENPPYSLCDTALAQLARFHFTYLNGGWNEGVLDGWRDRGCYDEIDRRLGYRLAFVEGEATPEAPPGGELRLRVVLENTGFAAPVRPHGVAVIFARSGDIRVAQLADAELRRWLPGEPIELDLDVVLPSDVVPGHWALGLRLAAPGLEDPRFALGVVNEGAWDTLIGANVLNAEVRIVALAPGPRPGTPGAMAVSRR